MHHIYHTKGVILSSRNIGEANKIFSIYTRELGMVHATAQGIRFSKSKLRFSLQDFYYASIDLVRGKELWKITSATSISSFPIIKEDKDSILLVARVGKLLERLCQGESANEIIFDDFIQALYLLDDLSFNDDSRMALELHLVLRILHSLGYIAESDDLIKYIVTPFDNSKINSLISGKQSIISHINKALNESQL